MSAARPHGQEPAILYFEDFTEGQMIDLGRTAPLSEEEIIGFARQWDPQPFHVDPVAAKESIYGGLIASGWQTALLSMRLLVDSVLSHTDAHGSPGVENVRFRKPVRPGEPLASVWLSRLPTWRRMVSRAVCHPLAMSPP